MTDKPGKEKKPWRPKLDTGAEFNPFVSPIAHLDEREPGVLEDEAAEELAAAEAREEAGSK